MVHSRDDEGIGVAHEIILPNNQSQFSQTIMGQYWLSKTKLLINLKYLQKVAMELLKKS